jgi:hypothetical protein
MDSSETMKKQGAAPAQVQAWCEEDGRAAAAA